MLIKYYVIYSETVKKETNAPDRSLKTVHEIP